MQTRETTKTFTFIGFTIAILIGDLVLLTRWYQDESLRQGYFALILMQIAVLALFSADIWHFKGELGWRATASHMAEEFSDIWQQCLTQEEPFTLMLLVMNNPVQLQSLKKKLSREIVLFPLAHQHYFLMCPRLSEENAAHLAERLYGEFATKAIVYFNATHLIALGWGLNYRAERKDWRALLNRVLRLGAFRAQTVKANYHCIYAMSEEDIVNAITKQYDTIRHVYRPNFL